MKIQYTCRHCGRANYIKSFWEWFRKPHFGTRKRIRCDRCGKVSYMKRWDNRTILDWPTDK